jgi:hypothetical protein
LQGSEVMGTIRLTEKLNEIHTVFM